MNTKEFFAALDLLEKEKGISKDIIIEAFEHALISAYKKNFNQATNVKLMRYQELLNYINKKQ